jgi:hypothetical protein
VWWSYKAVISKIPGIELGGSLSKIVLAKVHDPIQKNKLKQQMDEGLALMVVCLPSKHEALTSNLNSTKKKKRKKKK